MQPQHKALALKAAMNILYKNKQYKSCSQVAKLLITQLDSKKDAQGIMQT